MDVKSVSSATSCMKVDRNDNCSGDASKTKHEKGMVTSIIVLIRITVLQLF